MIYSPQHIFTISLAKGTVYVGEGSYVRGTWPV